MVTIEPCRDASQLRHYIDTHWLKDHILARDERMFAFQYQTPWVDRRSFPHGISVMGAYDGDDLVGFIGAIVAPYPRERSFWLALWHVLPILKGGGMGGKLLQAMQDLALGDDDKGWIGTFGAGPEALPVYLKRGYAVRASRRWIYEPTPDGISLPGAKVGNVDERLPDAAWLDYRYGQHPVFRYERAPGGIFRSEHNAWGAVTHVLLLRQDWRQDVAEVYAREHASAIMEGLPFLMDTWAYDCPGPGWSLASNDLPSVFWPPTARGNLIYASGCPFVPMRMQKGDCDQDRPN